MNNKENKELKLCKKCKIPLKIGIAMQSTIVCDRDNFEVLNIATCWEGGPGKIIKCLKCEQCGYSITF